MSARNRIHASWQAAAALVVSALVAAAPAARAQATPPADPTLELARTKYSPAEWPRGERRDGFVLEELSLPGLAGREVEFEPVVVARTYADAKGVARVLVEMEVGESVADAHAALLRHVAYVQSTKTLATAASRSLRAGDVGYVAYGGKDVSRIAWVAFVVGNLEFRVVKLEPDAEGAPDLAPLVELLSARALALPPLAADAPVSKPQVRRFTAERATFPAGASILLDVAATDPTGRAPRLDFEIGAAPNGRGGQGYVEPDDQGRWRFHATGPGHATIIARVLGRNGTTATKSIAVEIAAK